MAQVPSILIFRFAHIIQYNIVDLIALQPQFNYT
jgi:hypothetical protein